MKGIQTMTKTEIQESLLRFATEDLETAIRYGAMSVTDTKAGVLDLEAEGEEITVRVRTEDPAPLMVGTVEALSPVLANLYTVAEG